MTQEEMKNWVTGRIELINDSGINENLPISNVILLDLFPSELCENNPIDWNDRNNKNRSINCFRRFTDAETEYTIHEDYSIGYTPHKEYFMLFQNGIVEVFHHPIRRETFLRPEIQYIRTENIIVEVRNFLLATRCINNRIYETNPPYYLFITLVGIHGSYFMSLDRNYVNTNPFEQQNARFEPFIIEDININYLPEIMNGIHYGIRSYGNWENI